MKSKWKLICEKKGPQGLVWLWQLVANLCFLFQLATASLSHLRFSQRTPITLHLVFGLPLDSLMHSPPPAQVLIGINLEKKKIPSNTISKKLLKKK